MYVTLVCLSVYDPFYMGSCTVVSFCLCIPQFLSDSLRILLSLCPLLLCTIVSLLLFIYTLCAFVYPLFSLKVLLLCSCSSLCTLLFFYFHTVSSDCMTLSSTTTLTNVKTSLNWSLTCTIWFQMSYSKFSMFYNIIMVVKCSVSKFSVFLAYL